MLRDMIANQWLWLVAAASLIIILLGLVRVIVRAGPRQSQMAAQNQAGEGWTPTGRIDFAGPSDPSPDSHETFFLQAEDARIVNSIAGLEHHETRWRKATLKEAKKVVKSYHAQLDLPITATPLVTFSDNNSPKTDFANGSDVLPAGTDRAGSADSAGSSAA
jgi:hypothetical protein